MKLQFRALGIDDAPFKFRQEKVIVIGAVVRGKNYLEGVLKTEVKVDGKDATRKLITLINNSRFKEQIKVIFLDGIALGGFNLVDIKKLYMSTGVPVITVTRHKPDYAKIEQALKKHFKDWKRRLKIIKATKVERIVTKHNPLWVCPVGISLQQTAKLLPQATVRGVLPEAIRVAHLIASAYTKGESYGRA
jgi:hypothetical protein